MLWPEDEPKVALDPRHFGIGEAGLETHSGEPQPLERLLDEV